MRKLIALIAYLTVFFSFSQTKTLDNLILELAFLDSNTLKVETSIKLIKSLYDIKDYDRAIKYIIESEKLSTTLKYDKGIAEITYYKALVYAQKNDYINAIAVYEKSKTLFQKLKDTLGIAKVNNRIGLMEIKRGNYSKGLQYSLSAIGELEKKHLNNELNTAYSDLADAFFNINAFDKSIEFNLKALQVQGQLNDVKGTTVSMLSLAELFSIKKENRKAIEYYEKVLTDTEPFNDSIRQVIFPKLGGEYLKFNDYENASKYLKQGLKLNRSAINDLGLLTTLNNLGDLNMRQNRLTLAEKQLLEAGAIAKKIDNKQELLKHYKLMKDLDSIRKNFDKAYIWQRNYFNLKESLNKKSMDFDITDLEPPELDSGFDNDLLYNSFTGSGNKVTLANQVKFNRLELIFYALLVALASVSTVLVLIYLKRNNTLKYIQELEDKNIKIELHNQAFLEQTKHLEDINNVKDKLFSIVSHDLKDSLTSINGFIDLLRDGSLTREEFDSLIPELSENANNASLLLFNLLNWSKSQMHSLEPNPSLFDIQEVFEDKLKLIEKRLESKDINLKDNSLSDFVYADKSMFEIIVQNLLANAIKFSKSGDTITISNHISNGNCIISVADTGIGISEENIEKLFKNIQFTTVGTIDEKGTGLGLSICKELVELNNGKIWVESKEGVGSTFYVKLPKFNPA